MDLVVAGSNPSWNIGTTLLLDAVTDGNADLARSLLKSGGASISAINEDGQTALHLAVLNGHESLLGLLLEQGADIEAPAKDGSKPLYIAAKSGNLSLVESLLLFNAHVESFNVKTQTTAFYQAVGSYHETVAKSLLEHGADIDATVPNGHTALYSAVVLRKLDVVEFLLRHGANKKMLESEGVLDRLAGGDDLDQEILRILQRAQLVQGPTIHSSKKAAESRFIHVPSLPATRGQVYRRNVCHSFEATIVDFFVGDHEQRVQVSASVFDILYGIGPEATMGMARDPQILETKPDFRWYHLPANNVGFPTSSVPSHKIQSANILSDGMG